MSCSKFVSRFLNFSKYKGASLLGERVVKGVGSLFLYSQSLHLKLFHKAVHLVDEFLPFTLIFLKGMMSRVDRATKSSSFTIS